MTTTAERNVLYLHMNGPDETIHISDLGIDLRGVMCGLIAVDGTLRLRETNPSTAEKRLYLCSDLCTSQSLISGGARLPILRQLCVDSTSHTICMDIANVLWLETPDLLVRNIRLYIKNGNGESISVQDCHLNLTILTFPKNE